jgi:hypothetical protein
MKTGFGETLPAPTEAGKLMSTQLSQIAKRAKLDRKARFTSLAHLLTPEFLTETWGKMNRRAAGGIDGVSAKQFEGELGTQVEVICAQLKAGTYRALLGAVPIPVILGGLKTVIVGAVRRRFSRFSFRRPQASGMWSLAL